MKKFVVGLIFVKAVFLFSFAFTSCQTAELSRLESQAAASPTATPTNPNESINRPTSEPYTGDLSIFEDENRAKNLQIDRVMDILKIEKGKSVADIGAGSGWFTTRAAKQVGEKGKIFAVEINQEYINYINARAKKESLKNIQTVLGAEDDPKLAPNSIDAALVLKTYHEIAEPVKVMTNLRRALKRNALVGIIDKNGKGDDHGLDKEIIIQEMRRAGFTVADQYDFVKPDGMDYFLVFRSIVR